MTASKREAIEIAKKRGAINENGRYNVKFDKRCQDLGDLLTLCSDWKLSHVLINNKKYPVSEVSEVIFCENRRRCNGKCEHGRSDYVYLVNEIEKCINNECDEDFDSEWMSETLLDLDAFEKQADSSFKIKKDVLKQSLDKQYVIPKNVCDKFDLGDILEQIERLPDSFVIPQTENGCSDYSLLYSSEREKLIESANIIAPILAEAIAKKLDNVIIANFGSEKNAASCSLKGKALFDLDRYDESLEYYDKALTMEPTNSKYWYEKGLTLEIGLEKYEEASVAYTKSFEYDPNNVLALHRKGICLDSVGKESEAIATYERTIELYEEKLKKNPTDKNTKEHLKWVKENLSAFKE